MASASSALVVTSTLAAISSCSAWLIRSAATCTGSAVWSARIAISVGPGLGVDADLRAADPLGGGDVDVAGAGDHVDRRQLGAVGVGAAVGQQRDGLRAADGPHLVDAEQRGGGQDGRVRQAAELGLRRAGDHQRVDAGGLRGHDVHHDARRVDGVAAGHVEPDALDRAPSVR